MNGSHSQGNQSHRPGNFGQGGGQKAGGYQGGKKHDTHTPREPLKKIVWFNADNTLNADLFSDTAEDYAKKLGSQDSKNENSQVRGFFDELIRIQMSIGRDEKKYKEQLPFLLMLRSKVYYSKGRKLVNEDFVEFMDQGLELSKKGLREFEIFVRFFEAFLGFFKYYKEMKKR